MLAVAVFNGNRSKRQAQRLSLPQGLNRSGIQTQRFFCILLQFFGVPVWPKCCCGGNSI